MISDFYNMIFASFGDFFRLLDSIKPIDAVNMSVLDIIIANVMLSVMIPLLVTIASRRGGADNG